MFYFNADKASLTCKQAASKMCILKLTVLYKLKSLLVLLVGWLVTKKKKKSF